MSEVVAVTDAHERDRRSQVPQGLCAHPITAAVVRHLEDVDRGGQEPTSRETAIDRLLGISGQQSGEASARDVQHQTRFVLVIGLQTGGWPQNLHVHLANVEGVPSFEHVARIARPHALQSLRCGGRAHQNGVARHHPRETFESPRVVCVRVSEQDSIHATHAVASQGTSELYRIIAGVHKHRAALRSEYHRVALPDIHRDQLGLDHRRSLASENQHADQRDADRECPTAKVPWPWPHDPNHHQNDDRAGTCPQSRIKRYCRTRQTGTDVGDGCYLTQSEPREPKHDTPDAQRSEYEPGQAAGKAE